MNGSPLMLFGLSFSHPSQARRVIAVNPTHAIQTATVDTEPIPSVSLPLHHTTGLECDHGVDFLATNATPILGDRLHSSSPKQIVQNPEKTQGMPVTMNSASSGMQPMMTPCEWKSLNSPQPAQTKSSGIMRTTPGHRSRLGAFSGSLGWRS